VIRNGAAAMVVVLGTAMEDVARVRALSMGGPNCKSKLMQSLAVRLEADYGRENGLEDGNAASKLVVLQLFDTSAAGAYATLARTRGFRRLKPQSREWCVDGGWQSRGRAAGC
jgi:hypothetical protein